MMRLARDTSSPFGNHARRIEVSIVRIATLRSPHGGEGRAGEQRPREAQSEGPS